MNCYQFSDIRVGDQEVFTTQIDSQKLEKFLEISGDINPLHTDSEYARSKGFMNRVVYGMLTSSFYSTLVGVYLPGKFCILQNINVQFSKPVYVGDVLTVKGAVSYINEAYKQIEIKAKIVNQNDTVVSKATIKVGVMDE